MPSYAAVMTGPGTGAIATIQLCGDSTQVLLEQVFKPTGNGPAEFETGHILLGHIIDGAETIDQVTIGYEGCESFAIHCHGNPLIVETIMKLLERHGVHLLSPEHLLAVPGSDDAIADEAKLALTRVKTLAGAKLIAYQVEEGLSQKVRQWRQQLESGSLGDVADDTRSVLHDSEIARLLIEGCTVVLFGPAGAGKSTLLNTLAGRRKAIVTGIKGTTRDWVSAEIHLPPLAVTLIDTAGLTSTGGGIDQAAQARSLEVLERADVVLLVLDITESARQIDGRFTAGLSAKKVLPVLNKADLPASLDVGALPPYDHAPVRISAKQGAGINELIAAVARINGVTDFDPHTPIAFTSRQRRLLESLTVASNRPEDAIACLDDLLGGSGPPEMADEKI